MGKNVEIIIFLWGVGVGGSCGSQTIEDSEVILSSLSIFEVAVTPELQLPYS